MWVHADCERDGETRVYAADNNKKPTVSAWLLWESEWETMLSWRQPQCAHALTHIHINMTDQQELETTWGHKSKAVTTSITWKRVLKEEVLDDLPWKDERGPSSVKQTLELFQRQRWGNVWHMGWSAYGLFQALKYHHELNWTDQRCCECEWWDPAGEQMPRHSGTLLPLPVWGSLGAPQAPPGTPSQSLSSELSSGEPRIAHACNDMTAHFGSLASLHTIIASLSQRRHCDTAVLRGRPSHLLYCTARLTVICSDVESSIHFNACLEVIRCVCCCSLFASS